MKKITVTDQIELCAVHYGISVETILTRMNLLGWSLEDSLGKRPVGDRPSNDAFFMRIAGQVALRSTCARRAVGCVIVDSFNRILSTGYNSVASKRAHCTSEKPCPGASCTSGTGLHLCEARHAEDIALMKCSDIHTIHTIYSTTEPCELCARRLLDTSCVRIVFAEKYPSGGQALWTEHRGSWEHLQS